MNAPRLNISDAVLDEVLQSLARGHKLEAIKVLKNATGLSLMEAKQLAEQLEAEQVALAGPGANAASVGWQTAAKQLLMQGKKLQAIKVCREQTRLSLQLAKEKVEELAAREGIPDRSVGCVPVMVVALVLAAAIGMGVWWAMS